MITFDKSDLQRFAISSVGAVAVSAAFLLAAAGPARAATPVAAPTASAWQNQVQRKIETGSHDMRVLDGVGQVKNVTLAAHFTADGDYAGAEIAKSSGMTQLDRRAVQIINHVAYPALPVAYRGQAQTVTMRLYFGNDAQKVADAIAKAPVQFAFTPDNAGGAGATMAAR